LSVLGGKNEVVLWLSYLDGGFALAVVADLQGSYGEVADSVELAAAGRGGGWRDAFFDTLGKTRGCEKEGSE
jgi:hypothetical protein